MLCNRIDNGIGLFKSQRHGFLKHDRLTRFCGYDRQFSVHRSFCRDHDRCD